MSSLEESMDAIESLEFIANVAVAGGVKSFISILKSSENVRNVIRLTSNSLENLEKVILRLLTLLHDRGERHFLHKHDFEVATYLVIISEVGPEYLPLLLEEVDWTEGLRWGLRISRVLSSPTYG